MKLSYLIPRWQWPWFGHLTLEILSVKKQVKIFVSKRAKWPIKKDNHELRFISFCSVTTIFHLFQKAASYKNVMYWLSSLFSLSPNDKQLWFFVWWMKANFRIEATFFVTNINLLHVMRISELQSLANFGRPAHSTLQWY